MTLYKPPLKEKQRKDSNTAPSIKDALKGLKVVFHYTGQRVGKDLIELQVCTLIEDEQENLFLRLSTYTGVKEHWKEVILNQVKQHLKDLQVEEGFIKSETRYLEVDPTKHLNRENFDKLYSSLERRINKKRNENNTLRI